jgi:formate hydrogenlyase subunit 6/NADH:ubiquinone oxidoreductase subunit I
MRKGMPKTTFHCRSESIRSTCELFLSRYRSGHQKNGCATGCIACGICEKVCPHGAIHVVKDPAQDSWPNPRGLKNVAVIDYDKCTGCGICVSKCPQKP